MVGKGSLRTQHLNPDPTEESEPATRLAGERDFWAVEKSKCKGPEADACLVSLRKSREANETEARGDNRRKITSEPQGGWELGPSKDPECSCQEFGF